MGRVINYHGWFDINIKQYCSATRRFFLSGNKENASQTDYFGKNRQPESRKLDPKFLTVLGAAKRGLIPRKMTSSSV